MPAIRWNSFLVSPFFFGIALTSLTNIAYAKDLNLVGQVISRDDQLVQPYPAMEQVTSVSALSDVKPTDWAFQALQSLVERYGCVVGYPNRTFKGNQALTRYEFAVALNSCLNQIEELLAASTVDFTKQTELEPIKKMMEEFAAELATLRGQMNSLEVRTATLEKQQFSTTTTLFGEAIFALTNEFNQDQPSNRSVFQNRVRLDLQTSFTGKDVLHARLTAGNATRFFTPSRTREGTQQFNIVGNTQNNIQLDWLSYLFPVGDRLLTYVAATGGKHSDYVASTFNPYLQDYDGGHGALSTFGQQSPIYRIGGGAGIALNYKLSNAFALSAGYLAGPDAANPAEKNGLFDGNNAILGQITVSPTNWLQFGITYVHGYHKSGIPIFNQGTNQSFVGTPQANNFYSNRYGKAVSTNSYGTQVSLKINRKFTVSGFFGYTKVTPTGSIIPGIGTTEDIWYYGTMLAFPDLLKQGNLAGLVVGKEPYLASDRKILNQSHSWHVEGFYRYQVNDHISITPGVIWISNPNQNNNTSDIVIGTIRMTFRF